MIPRNVFILIALMISSSLFAINTEDLSESAPLNCKNGFTYEIQADSLTLDFSGFVNVNDPTTYAWDFGDGNTGTGENVSHTYSVSSSTLFEICLTTESIDSTGSPCVDISCQSVWVGTSSGCVAYFTGTPSPSNPITWQFNDFSSGNPENWSWDFGDGTTSTLQNPLHEFPNAGEYMVCLSISDNAGGCQDTYCEEITVEGVQGDCFNDFTYSSADLFTFDFYGYLVDTTLQVYQYDWNFGDGTFGSGQSPVHTFEVGPTFYTVCLLTSVIMPGGDTCKYETCHNVYIGTAPDCQALYSWEYTGEPFEILLTDESFGDPTSWYWDFGDSTHSTDQHPVHRYTREGTYAICLTITNDITSCTSTLCSDVYVGNVPPPPTCDNTIDHTVDTTGHVYSFHGEAYSDGVNVSIDSWFYWNFDDGSTATGQDVVHTFPIEGDYDVELKTVTYFSAFDSCVAYSYFTVIIGDPDFCISGYVYLSDSTSSADEGEVHLMALDTATNTLAMVETMPIGSDGHYMFEGLEIGNPYTYYVQAELSEQSTHYGQYVPTYHYDAIHWVNAWLAIPHACPPNTHHNIFMHESTAAASGNGNIFGIVYSDDTKGVISEMEILLLGENLAPKDYTYTNENGEFSFGSIEYGTYYVYPEKVGIETNGFMIVLSEEMPFKSINIIVGNGTASLSVDENSIVSISGELYPNPAKTQISFMVSAEHAVNAEISIYNQLGQEMKIQKQSFNKGLNSVDVGISDLPKSIYFLRLQINESKPIMRKFIKID